MKQYIKRNTKTNGPYETAKNLALRYMPQLTVVVKGIRESGIRIRDISPDVPLICRISPEIQLFVFVPSLKTEITFL